jgi:hypothetical protein
MQKLTLPLIMIASLTTLVSCGTQAPEASPLISSPPPVTGVVETQSTVSSGVTVSSGTTSPVVNPVRPEVFTRTETVTYQSPADPQDPVEFSVTVADGVITAVSATSKSTSDISQQYQTAFTREISRRAIGKKAKDLKLDAVGGASLTTAAFEQFVHSF